MKRLWLLLLVFLAACAQVNLPGPAGTTGHDDANPIYQPGCGSQSSPITNTNALGCSNAGTNLYTYITKEKAGEDVEYGFHNFVYTGIQANACRGTTGPSLVMTPTSCIGYNAGLRGTETGSITFADNSTTWVAMDENVAGSNAGLPNFSRASGTHYLIDSIDASQPTMVADSQLLMKVTTSGGAITAVVDLRNTSAIPLPILNIKDFGARGDGTSDDTSAFNAALAACTPSQFILVPTASVYYKITSLITSTKNCSFVGEGWEDKNTGNPRFGSYDITKVTGSVIYQATAATGALKYASGANDIIALVMRDIAVIGPGSGVSNGVQLGAGGSTYIDKPTLDHVLIANFSTGLDLFGQSGTFLNTWVKSSTTGYHLEINGSNLTNQMTFVGGGSWFSDTCVTIDGGQADSFYGGFTCEQPITNGFVLNDCESCDIGPSVYLENVSNSFTGDGILIEGGALSNSISNQITNAHFNLGTSTANNIHIANNGSNTAITRIIGSIVRSGLVGILIDASQSQVDIEDVSLSGATTAITNNATAGEVCVKGTRTGSTTRDNTVDCGGSFKYVNSTNNLIDFGRNLGSGAPSVANQTGERLILNNGNTGHSDDDTGIGQTNGSTLWLNVPTGAGFFDYIQGAEEYRLTAASGAKFQLKVTSVLGVGAVPAALATFGTCDATHEGLFATQTNSTGACSAGATATNAGTTHCAIYCNGTNWLQLGI